MPFNPGDFGITTEVSIENLVNARDQYVKLVNSLKGDSVKAEAPKLNSEDDQKAADSFTLAFRRWLFDTLDANPILSTVLADELANASKDVREFRNWFVADAARNGAPVVSNSDADDSVKGLKQFTTFLYNAAVSFKLEIPEDFKVKKAANGDTVPDLPRGPYGKGEATVKKVGGYTLRYRFFPGAKWLPSVSDFDYDFPIDSIEIPEGTMTDEIAIRYISTPLYRVERTAVFDSLPHRENGTTPTGRIRKHLDMPKDGSSVHIQFDSGVLEAWLPANAPAEIEEADDSENENEEADSE